MGGPPQLHTVSLPLDDLLPLPGLAGAIHVHSPAPTLLPLLDFPFEPEPKLKDPLDDLPFPPLGELAIAPSHKFEMEPLLDDLLQFCDG